MRRSGQIINKGKDKWLVRIYVGRDPVSNKRLYDSEVVNGRQSDAKSKLNELLTKKDQGRLVRKTNLTLGKFLSDWVESVVKARVREATYESYKYHLERYLDNRILNTQLPKLRPFEIQKHYNGLRENYSPRTVRYVHTILRNALKKAVELRLISENPCDFAELPKRQKRELKIFSPEEAQRFLKAAQSNKHGLIFEFALLTGARPEEYLALKWADVDFNRSSVTFQRTLLWRKGGGWYFDEQMKTAHSRRTIPLPTVLLNKLKRHRVEQAQRTLKLGARYERNDLIFATEQGTPLHYGNITKRYFQPILTAAELDHHRLYSLRHSCATLLLVQGVNMKIIQERLGHADITLTLSTYSHVLEGMQEHASNELGSLLYGK